MFAIAAVLVAGVIGWYWKGESSRESDAAVMDPIRCDPRFAAVIERLRTTDPHAPTICGKKD
jgi:hypothetical protein